MLDLVSLDVKALNLSASKGVTKVQVTSVDIYNFLVILTYRQYAKKIDGMVYIKNITGYVCTAELIFLWFYKNTYFFLILQKKQKDISLSGLN